MLMIIFLVVIAIQIFRTARDYGRNPYLWTAAAVVGFFVIQFVIGLAIGVAMLAGIMMFGWSESIFTDYALLINLAGLIPAVILVWLIAKYVGRVRDDEPASAVPPPPTFNP